MAGHGASRPRGRSLRHFDPPHRLWTIDSPGDNAGGIVPHSTSILLLGDGAEASRLRQRLSRHFLAVENARSVEESRELARRCRFHVLVVVDPPAPWHELQRALEASEELPSATLLVTEKSRAEAAIEALRSGVSDVLLRPFSTDELVAAVTTICSEAVPGPRAGLGTPGQTLVGDSGPMREIRALVERVAPTASTVLIEGESGTGRKLLARLLHEQSGRVGPFTTVACGTADRDALERTLAGRERETAAGTLFLDDIDALPLDLQARLLRSMVDAAAKRIVAATRANLAELVRRHRFREQLWQRLQVLRIGLPPLRERRADIPLLVAYFADRLSAEMGRPPVEFRPEELEALGDYDWPGNIAELRRAVEQRLLRGQLPADALVGTVERDTGAPDYPLDWTLEQVKRHHMICVLDACNGNKSAAARRLDISRKTLDRKLGPVGQE
jgi:DNA-binding NtrC family response regulator